MAGLIGYLRSVPTWAMAGLTVFVVALVLVWVAWGGGAAGLFVGIIGVVGTVVAAWDARQSSKEVVVLTADAKAAVEHVSAIADDLSLTSRIERLDRIRRAVQAIRLSAASALHDLTAPPLQPEIEELMPPDEPAPLDQGTLGDLTGRLLNALGRKGALSLPQCGTLLQETWHLYSSLDPPDWPLAGHDALPRNANADELRALIATTMAALDEVRQPADQIPTVDD